MRCRPLGGLTGLAWFAVSGGLGRVSGGLAAETMPGASAGRRGPLAAPAGSVALVGWCGYEQPDVLPHPGQQ